MKSAPLSFCKPILWLARGGEPALKAGLAEHTNVDVTVLPYDAVLDWLKCEREAGRRLVLATASHKRYAEAIADHLGLLFDETCATTNGVNLSAQRKRDRLVAEFGEKNFDYAGNSHDDMAVWQAAERAYVVNPDSGVESAARNLGNVERVIETRSPPLRTWTKSLRLHQWLMNLLIFVVATSGAQDRGTGADRSVAARVFRFRFVCFERVSAQRSA